MSQPDNQDPERGNVTGTISSSPFTCQIHTYVEDRLSAPNSSQPSHGESNIRDSSAPLFTIYTKISEEEDNKMAERWQKDADGIIIFVRPKGSVHSAVY